MSEPQPDRIRRGNFRAALACLISEHLPVADPYTNEMIDAAWRIADRLEPAFWTACEREFGSQERAALDALDAAVPRIDADGRER